jgi:hypothetical protein
MRGREYLSLDNRPYVYATECRARVPSFALLEIASVTLLIICPYAAEDAGHLRADMQRWSGGNHRRGIQPVLRHNVRGRQEHVPGDMPALVA